MLLTLPLLAWGLGVLGSPLERRTVSVSIANGTVIGGADGNVEFFKGIPFAKPPVGDLRFRHPQPFNANFGQLDATKTPPVCLQVGGAGSEDCLKLIVLRPASRPAARLPVLVFIHGGAFSSGSAEEGNNGTPIVKKSIEMGAPIIAVSIQYRLGALGFLPGKELAGNTNLGLRDQRLALQWVQDNIEAFGGDPRKVVLWGFSAGAMSSFDHTIINGGEANGLFRGVILGSGTMLSARSFDDPKAQQVYDTVVDRAGCRGSADTLECLRGLDAQKLIAATGSLNTEFRYLGGNPPYLPRPDASDAFFPTSADAALAAGKFARVPVLSGTSEDEGTLFAATQMNITDNAKLVAYLKTYYPGSEQYVSTLVSKYPDDLGISGSPFNTGLSNNLFGQYKRLAALLGDTVFIFQRRYHLQKISAQQVPAWSYHHSAFYGTPILGSFHGSDAVATISNSTSSVPAETQRRTVIAFINTLDPNGLGTSSPLISWPKYSVASQSLRQDKLWNALMKDDFRSQQFQYWSDNIAKFRI